MTVGRLNVMKGHRYLVEAAAELADSVPQLVVVVVGEGHLRGRLEQQVAAAGLGGAVVLAGHRADARLLLDAADVFVLPSLHEGMPLALLEAMEAGLPVVATGVIGSAEVVEHERTGLLVPPRRSGALAAALRQTLGDGELRARMRSAGKQRYLDRYTSARSRSSPVGSLTAGTGRERCPSGSPVWSGDPLHVRWRPDPPRASGPEPAHRLRRRPGQHGHRRRRAAVSTAAKPVTAPAAVA